MLMRRSAICIASGVAIAALGLQVDVFGKDAPKVASGGSPDLLMQIEEMKRELRSMKERQEIHEVLMRYGRGIDRLDEKTYRSAFWPDAQINYGTKESITPDQHWNVHMMTWHNEGLKSWGHLLTNETMNIDGDVAHVETYAVAMPMSKDEEPGIMWGGRYIDRLDRRNGEWRIAVREFIPFFAMKTDKIYSWLDGYKGNAPGCIGDAWSWRGTKDTSYVRPLPRRAGKESGPPCTR